MLFNWRALGIYHRNAPHNWRQIPPKLYPLLPKQSLRSLRHCPPAPKPVKPNHPGSNWGTLCDKPDDWRDQLDQFDIDMDLFDWRMQIYAQWQELQEFLAGCNLDEDAGDSKQDAADATDSKRDIADATDSKRDTAVTNSDVNAANEESDDDKVSFAENGPNKFSIADTAHTRNFTAATPPTWWILRSLLPILLKSRPHHPPT